MRKNQAPKRDLLPDPVFNSKVVAKAINGIMQDGKKGLAQKIMYDALNLVASKTGEDSMEVFNRAIENITPQLELKVRRVGGANYQVPVEVRTERKQTLALR
jgi:small subunit ribosomal protein S7